jgi:hypothetical protein
MAKLVRKMSSNSRSFKTLNSLFDNQKINVLTSKESYKIDNKIDLEFKKINEDYVIRERYSMISIAQLEASSKLI